MKTRILWASLAMAGSLFLVMLLTRARVVQAQGPIEVLEEFVISSVEGSGYQAVSGDIVVFDKNNDIYSYNLSTRTGFRITDQAAYQGLPDISGNTVVWMDGRNGNWDIYGYDLGEDREFQITDHAADQEWPVIDGKTVVWVDWRNGGDSYGGYSLYGYDLASGTEFRISGHSAPIAYPAISGNVVVWSERRYAGWNVYGYDLGSGTETQITHGWAPSPYCPAISNGIIVLGEGDSVGGFDLSGILLFETPTLLYPFYGRPAVDGNLVVWQERDPLLVICLYYPCPSTIVGYEVISGQKFLVPRGVHEAWHPAISSDVVVWREFSTAFELDPPPPPPVVYVSKLLETVQLSVNSQFVDPGDVLTYTIALVEATTTSSHKSITDSLSSFTTLNVPSLSANAGNYGYDPATHIITWTGVVSSDNPITITYNATVTLDASVGDHITNTVIISDQTSVFSRTVSSWVARRTYLPIIVKSYSP